MGKECFYVEGPCCPCGCCSEVEFKIMSMDETTEVGKITKQWRGLTREAFTDADTFAIDFPRDIDLPMKATLLGISWMTLHNID